MLRTCLRSGSGLLLASLFGACVSPTASDAPSDTVTAKAPDSWWHSLDDGKMHSIIVALDDTQPMTSWHVAKARMVAEAPAAEAVMEREWDALPLVQVQASSTAAAVAMFDRDEVIAAFAPERYELTDAESFPLIDQPAAVAAGFGGKDTSVAIIDTGTDYTRAAFGSCTAPGVPASTCRVAVAMDFAPDDGSLDANGHGTNVAGITLGVAPDTRILALDVFTGEGAYNSDIISAINWSVQNKDKYKIAAMNLSLGGGSSTTPCSNDAMGIALASARSAGIAPVVASGNNGFTNAISSPGCAPAAISVGAVYDSSIGGIGYSACKDATTAADKITCFSNSASFLTVLAPGAMITAAGITMAGTSQAAPHVAGAMAVLRSANPTSSVDDLVAKLVKSGKTITDARNGVSTPRIDVFAALKTSGDITPPEGSVKINDGASSTKAAAVNLTIQAPDATLMCVTNTTTCSSYVAFAASKAWTLAAGAGTKTVTVFLRDAAGNTTTATSSPKATITLDTTVPTNGTVTAHPGDASIRLEWNGFADTGTGIASYRVVGGTTAPASCTGTALYTGAERTYTATGLVNGAKYTYRVCAVDGAGNMSAGSIVTATPVPETTAPTGSIKIASGVLLTSNPSVVLAVSAADDSGTPTMCLSEAATCTAFVAFVASATFKLSATNGTHTIRAWFRDKWGNTSAPVSATIGLDTTAPTGGVLSATAQAGGKIALTWTAATDALAGFDSYKLVGAAGTAAPACATGLQLYAGTATTFTHTGLGTSATWSYRLCAKDKLGNTSTGSVKTATTPK